jgi:hypothetical protein
MKDEFMQRTDERIKNYNKDYFDRQFAQPYRSTITFCDWLEKIGVIAPESTINILDVGTGKGANLYYMSQRYKASQLTGIDLNPEFILEGNEILKSKNVSERCHLKEGDIYKFDNEHINRYDGIVSYQTLSWLPDFREPLKSMASLNATWIALTSLFFDGDVNCKIELEEYNHSIEQEPKQTFYNIYSLRLVERFLRNLGYSKFSYLPFEIDIDIPKPTHKIMGTYTEKLIDGKGFSYLAHCL